MFRKGGIKRFRINEGNIPCIEEHLAETINDFPIFGEDVPSIGAKIDDGDGVSIIKIGSDIDGIRQDELNPGH